MKRSSSKFLLSILVVGFLVGSAPMSTIAGLLDISSPNQTYFNLTEPLVFSTLFGNLEIAHIDCVGLDSDGDLYLAGTTISTDYYYDCFLLKLSGTHLVQICYSTFGGSNDDFVRDMFIDSDDRVYIIGETRSSDFPVKNALCSSYQNKTECYVICFDVTPTEPKIVFSTYLGGQGYEGGNSIFVDDEGAIFLTGHSSSPGFPLTHSIGNQSYYSSVFVTKLNSTGNGVIYSTKIGGNYSDYGYALAVDSQGNAYVAGVTASANFPTVNAYNTTSYYDSPNVADDGFVFCLNSTGNGLIFSTYIAGTDSEHFYDIALDSNNDVWVCGHTDSNDFPVVDSFQEYNGHDSSVIFELSSNGSSLLFSSIFGGAVYDRCSSLAIDERDNVYIAGSTYSSEFPLYHAEDSLSGKYYDCFVMKIGPEKTIQYSTRIGGSSNDWGNSLALGRNGAVFVGGDSQSDDFPLRREISEPSDDISTHNNGIAFILFDLSDEDGDQYPSWWELINGFDPLNPEVSFNELLTWYAPVIPTVIATSVLLVTLLVLLLSRHRIKSWFERKSSTLAVSQTK